MQKTPYELHETLAHDISRYSPNGIDVIIECLECPARFLVMPQHEPIALCGKLERTYERSKSK